VATFHVDTRTTWFMHRLEEDTADFIFQRKDAISHLRPELREHMNNHRNGYGWVVVTRKRIWCSWPPRSPDLYLWGYVRSAVFIPPPPTEIPKLDGRIIETVWSLIRGSLTKVCEVMGNRNDTCRVSSGLIILGLWNSEEYFIDSSRICGYQH
jgi:hypothetical protein